MCDKGHRFFKFDEASVVCRRCGDQKVVDVHALIAQLPAITYLPCPHPHPFYPATTPYIWGSGTNPWPSDITITYDSGTSMTSGTVPAFTKTS